MNSIVADKRGGAFADDVYVVLVDNRNGTIRDSNNDVFFYKSTDGGTTWIGPTRVNNDRSTTPAEPRLRAQPEQHRAGTRPTAGRTDWGTDQFFPWVTINAEGDLNVIFHDRRLDTDSPAGRAWPTSKTEVGNYLVWYWGGECHVSPADTRECMAPDGPGGERTSGPATPVRVRARGRRRATEPERLPVRELRGLRLAVQFRLHVPRRDLHGRLRGHRRRR